MVTMSEEKEMVDRIIGKALHFLVSKLKPNGLAVKDEKTGFNVVLFIDDDNILRMEETTEIETDLSLCTMIAEEDLAPSTDTRQ